MDAQTKKYLPLGTIILLKGATKRLMITGFCVSSLDKPGITFDYAGCVYPEGVLTSEQTALFNHDSIEKIFSLGFVDDEAKVFLEKLKALEGQAEDVI